MWPSHFICYFICISVIHLQIFFFLWSLISVLLQLLIICYFMFLLPRMWMTYKERTHHSSRHLVQTLTNLVEFWFFSNCSITIFRLWRVFHCLDRWHRLITDHVRETTFDCWPCRQLLHLSSPTFFYQCFFYLNPGLSQFVWLLSPSAWQQNGS